MDNTFKLNTKNDSALQVNGLQTTTQISAEVIE